MKFSHTSAYCENCGENISAEIAFCRSCGTALSENQVKRNIEQSRAGKNIPRAPFRKRSFSRKIPGAILVGFLEFLFAIGIFVVSFLISMNFFPDIADGKTVRLSTYFIVMMTTFVAGLTLGSYISRKFRERYPKAFEQ